MRAASGTSRLGTISTAMTRVVDHPPAAVVFDFDFDTALSPLAGLDTMSKLQWQVRDSTCVGVSRRIYSSCPVFAGEFGRRGTRW